MAVGIAVWSKTAATNASADSSVNWAEGQSPSSVNDSARALMASAAKFRDDINGSILTTGTSTAYAVTSNQSFAALTAGYMVAFTPHTTNGATVTLNVDALGAKPLRSAPNTELGAGVLIEGTPYLATYYTSNSGEWILHGFFQNPYNVPLGGMLPYTGSTAPNSNFVLPYGQAISRTTYATYFSLVSTTYGGGDGSTTFNVPDIRGRVVAGLDNMGGTSANRLTNQSGGVNGDTLGATGGAETHALTSGENAQHSHTITDPGHFHNITFDRNFDAPNSAGFAPLAAVNPGKVGGNQNGGRTESATTGISSTNNSGSGTAHNNVQPTIILPYILRII